MSYVFSIRTAGVGGVAGGKCVEGFFCCFWVSIWGMDFQIKWKEVTDQSSSVEPGKKRVIILNRKFTQKCIPNRKIPCQNIYCPSSIGIRVGMNCLLDRNLTGSAKWIRCFQNGIWSSWFSALTFLCKKEINSSLLINAIWNWKEFRWASSHWIVLMIQKTECSLWVNTLLAFRG